MRQFFSPAGAPIWLGAVLRSIRDALSDVWDTPLRLKSYMTGDLPPAANWEQGIAYDASTNTIKRSNGSSWEDVAGLGVHTVATLPDAGSAGRTAFVTDANATTFASIVAGGGANGVPVFDDGVNWRIG